MASKKEEKTDNEIVLQYGFRVDTNQLLTEMVEYGLPRSMGVMFQPIKVFRGLLVELSARAIELNDPELNILMLRLGLYEGTPAELTKAIAEQHRLIKK